MDNCKHRHPTTILAFSFYRTIESYGNQPLLVAIILSIVIIGFLIVEVRDLMTIRIID
ncbi:MAG: hypothetical protein AM325_007535 [Candidatus Thorarchaeota archaeon SMTZ1-45]